MSPYKDPEKALDSAKDYYNRVYNREVVIRRISDFSDVIRVQELNPKSKYIAQPGESIRPDRKRTFKRKRK